MIKICLFDMGGVTDIFDNAAMQRKMLAYLGDASHRLLSDFGEEARMLENKLCRGLVSDGKFWEAFSRLSGLPVPEDVHLYARFFNPRPNPGTIRIIEDLKAKGMRVVGATNVEPLHRAWHEAHHEYDVFDALYASDLMHLAKPDPAFFEAIATSEHLDFEEMVHVDDRLENVESARSLGIHALLFTTPEKLRSDFEALGLL